MILKTIQYPHPLLSVLPLDKNVWIAGGAVLHYYMHGTFPTYEPWRPQPVEEPQSFKKLQIPGIIKGSNSLMVKKKLEKIQDIDIFTASEADTKRFFDSLFSLKFKDPNIKFEGDSPSDDYLGRRASTGILRLYGDTYYINIIDFIHKNDPLTKIQDFDLTVCQMAIDHNYNIIVDPDNFHTIEDRVIEFVDFDSSFGRNVDFLLTRYGFKEPFDKVPESLIDQAKKSAWNVTKDRLIRYRNRGFEYGESVVYRMMQFE